jgi:hypothetical protein
MFYNRSQAVKGGAMSVDYFVAVHQANWPTAAAVQTCLAKRDYPVRLEQAPAEPFSPSPGALAVRFRGRPIELEASAVQLSPTVSYGYSFTRPPDVSHKDGEMQLFQMRPDDVFQPADITADLARLGAKGVSFGYGDRVLSVSFRGSSDEIRAGFYLMAAMIYCFDGYGFEFQGDTHGAHAYADDLVADAADDAVWARRQRELDAVRTGKDSVVSLDGLDKIFAYIQKSLRKPAP